MTFAKASPLRRALSVLALGATLACVAPTVASAATLRCDESMKTAFRPDGDTRVLSVRKVKKGEPLPNRTSEIQNYPSRPATFGADLCWVKLLVGPGAPGPAGAPSTSPGIGIEVWLPEKDVWNHRFHALGVSGWGNGTEDAVLGKINSSSGSDGSGPSVAAHEHAVVSTTDSGLPYRGGSFALRPDGSINTEGWRDWTYRGLYQQAVKTKALAAAYYGSPPKFSYFSGSSGGGRQGLHVAQNLPEQYDGILSLRPGPDWSSFIPEVYPALVALRDLGGEEPSRAQLEAVSMAAVSACDVVDGQHLGFILDIEACRYDPTKDPAVLCRSDGGANDTSSCITRKQALAMNKVWYGMTIDGSVPDPAVDNGWDGPPTGVRRWYGYPRGGSIRSLLNAGSWLGGPGVGRDVAAIGLRDPKIGTPDFKNATGGGQDGWKTLSYPQLAAAYEAFKALDPELGFNANNPDLTRLRNAGTKLLHVTHLHDSSVWVQGHTEYYERAAARMGGLAAVRPYYQLYVMPGLFHGNFNGAANPQANPPVAARGQLYKALVDWVEKGVSPETLVFSSPPPGTEPSSISVYPPSDAPPVSLPACAYPTVATHVAGDIRKAESYRCR